MPAHIIVYRDGASDTQIKKIAYEELESLERAIESVSYFTLIPHNLHGCYIPNLNLELFSSEKMKRRSPQSHT